MKLVRCVALFTAVTLMGAVAAFAQAATQPRVVRTPHRTIGKGDCLSCHGVAANADIKSVPTAHNYPNEACLNCHARADTMPPYSRHAMDAGHFRCVTCHVADSPTGAKPPPAASHANRQPTICTLCHVQGTASPG